jgi:hypothetical protein
MELAGCVTAADLKTVFPQRRQFWIFLLGPICVAAALVWRVVQSGLHVRDFAVAALGVLLTASDFGYLLLWRDNWSKDWLGSTRFEFGDFEFRATLARASGNPLAYSKVMPCTVPADAPLHSTHIKRTSRIA